MNVTTSVGRLNLCLLLRNRHFWKKNMLKFGYSIIRIWVCLAFVRFGEHYRGAKQTFCWGTGDLRSPQNCSKNATTQATFNHSARNEDQQMRVRTLSSGGVPGGFFRFSTRIVAVEWWESRAFTFRKDRKTFVSLPCSAPRTSQTQNKLKYELSNIRI